jgi:hypothetical protein
LPMLIALPRVFLRLAVVAAILSAAPLASAQSILLQPQGTFYRQQPIRPTGQQPHWISQSDCLAKDVISFPITMTGYLSYTLQVWAGNQGTDCSPANQRQAGGAATCWLVYSAPATASPTTIHVSAIDIVARNTPDVATPLGYPAACAAANSPPAGQQLTLMFMLISSGTSIVGSPVSWNDIGYDTAPPSGASNVAAASGETRVHLTWTDAIDSDIRSYKFYCDPPPGSVLADGGLKIQGPPLGTLDFGDGGSFFGTGGDLSFGLGGSFGNGGTGSLLGSGGTFFGAGGGSLISAGGSFFGTGGTGGIGGDTSLGGTGGTIVGGGTVVDTGGTTAVTATNCSADSVLQPGVNPTNPDANDPSATLTGYECGSVTGIIANNGTVSHLVNNVNYVFSVAAVDQVGNVGVLSQNACATPVNVTDFFELYKEAGGKAGGGICSMSFSQNPARTGILFAGGLLALAGVARRARRRQNR